MKFSCTRENLKEGLQIVAHIAGKHINLPILSNVYIKAYNSTITLATTDLEIGITTTIRGKVTEDGEFTVNAKLLNDYITLLPNERINITQIKNTLNITCGSYQTKMRGESSDDYPVIPIIKNETSFTLPLNIWQNAITEVSFATATNETRVELSGVYIIFSPKTVTFVATDGYRLAEKIITNNIIVTKERNVIIPVKTLQEVMRLNGNEQLTCIIGDSQIQFSYQETTLISRIIDGRYPDYSQIIPNNEQQKTTAQINRQELIRAIKAAALFSPNTVNNIHLDFPQVKKSVIVSAINTQNGETTSELAAATTGDDNGVVINYQYLLDGLTHITTKDIIFSMSDAASPCVLTTTNTPGYIYIVMPIKK